MPKIYTMAIFAPSASGKTSYIAEIPDLSQEYVELGWEHTTDGSLKPSIAVPAMVNDSHIFVDGDDVIAQTMGWPRAQNIHRDPERRFIYTAMPALILQLCLNRTDDRKLICLFNGVADHIDSMSLLESKFLDQDNIDICYVIRDLDTHKSFAKARREKHGLVFPTNNRDLNNNREYLSNSASALGIDVFDSFEEATANFGKCSYKIPVSVSDDAQEHMKSRRTIVDPPADSEPESNQTAWNFEWASRGYKEGETPKEAGSTRVVWKHPTGFYVVMKLFSELEEDDSITILDEPRTLKFWKTSDFKKDRMKWASSKFEFKPTDEEMDMYVDAMRQLWNEIPRSDFRSDFGTED
jgi:hypothetical protein